MRAKIEAIVASAPRPTVEASLYFPDLFRAYRRQPGSNPEIHKLSGQVLVNALTGEVGTSPKMSCLPTNQELRRGGLN